MRYRTALLEGFAGLKASPLGAETAERVCSRIKGTPMHVQRDPGTVIAGRTGIVYTPPVGETRIRELLATVYRGSANLRNRRFHTYCATAIPMSPPNKPPEAIPQYR